MEGGAFPLFLPGQEEVQGFQLFGQGLDVACFRGGNCLSEKGADGCLQGYRKGQAEGAASGTESPCSHLETVWRTTWIFSARSSWERPLDFRMVLMFSLSMGIPSFC